MKKLSKRVQFIMRAAFYMVSILLLWSDARVCFAGEVIFLRSEKDASVPQEQWQLATRFYGLNLTFLQIETPTDSASALKSVRRGETLAVVTTPAALQYFSVKQLLSAVRRAGVKSVPILILGITPATDSRQLALLSSDEISACLPLPPGPSGLSYLVGEKTEVTSQLAGVVLPVAALPSCSFSEAGIRRSQVLLSLQVNGRQSPVFVRSSERTSDLFFLAEMRPKNPSQEIAHSRLPDIFSGIAPAMMFVRYASGQHGWHTVGHFANLTIDDARLTEPYGHLNYQALLGEMEAHNFHTTIAFIPWNFDRNEPDVVSLFRAHPDRFSISVHGNNHDHREFGDYERSPLGEQDSNIQQAVGRMERFSELTGIPYDRVMVFPHGVAPEDTLAALKKYNFLSTANSEYVPLGSQAPDEAQFYLRAVTLKYANFAGLLRFSAEVPVPSAVIAINAFLDNPVLLYGHEKLFDEGIGSFDAIADEVNRIEPGIHWCGMGCVSQHLYLVKLREDGNMDVRAFTNSLVLENPYQRSVQFFVEKQENNVPEVTSLTMEGQPLSFEKAEGKLIFSIAVPAMGSRRVYIAYRNNLNVATIDVSRKSLYVSAVRQLAEFRDMTLSTSTMGRRATQFYYKHNMDAYELEVEKLLPFLLLLVVFGAIVKWFIRKKGGKKEQQSCS
jgi:hypothetical protein